MPIGRVLYWLLTGALIGFGVMLLTGALIGFGVMSDPSIGMYLLVFGVMLAIAGAVGLMSRGGSAAWIGLIVLGGLPAALPVWIFSRVPHWCTPLPGADNPPNISWVQCALTIFAVPVYGLWEVGFCLIALAGLVGLAWSLLRRLWSRPDGATASQRHTG